MARHGVRRHVVLELPGFLGCLASSGHGPDRHAAAPERETLAAWSASRSWLALSGCLPVDIKQHWHARFTQDPGAAGCAGCAKALMR